MCRITAILGFFAYFLSEFILSRPPVADGHAGVIRIAEKPPMICVGVNDSKFSTNDGAMADSNRKWEDGASFYNQNHAV